MKQQDGERGGKSPLSVETTQAGLARSLVDELEDAANGLQDAGGDGGIRARLVALASSGAMPSGALSTALSFIDRVRDRADRNTREDQQISVALQREEKKRERDEEAKEAFDGTVGRAREEQRREREREEWSRSSHRYAGIEMTGAEWGDLADSLKGDTPLRKWLVDRMMAKGKSRAEANMMTDEVALLAKMQSLPKDQWTDEMKALDQKLEADPERRAELDEWVKEAHDEKLGMSAQARSAAVTSESGHQVAAASSRSDCFASAPALTDHHRAALAARGPLDTEVARAEIKAPQPAAAAGLEF